MLTGSPTKKAEDSTWGLAALIVLVSQFFGHWVRYCVKISDRKARTVELISTHAIAPALTSQFAHLSK
ncbi:MAG: hypothetical protein MET45_20170 [Nostoc sp. LLA-1]|nr:hypothetical protein [Cyanocohniella sp. LLY]